MNAPINTLVKIYHRTAKDVTLRDDWSLTLPLSYDETRESWDEGRDYLLPDGYSIGRNDGDEMMIFDPTGRGCDIAVHSSGRPQLISAAAARPVLKRAGP